MSAFDEMMRVKAGLPRRGGRVKRKETKTSEKDTVYIDGHVIGFQFNKRSLGTRKVHCIVHDKKGTPYCQAYGITLLVTSIGGSSHHWEAFKRA